LDLGKDLCEHLFKGSVKDLEITCVNGSGTGTGGTDTVTIFVMRMTSP